MALSIQSASAARPPSANHVLADGDVVSMQVYRNMPQGECHSFDNADAVGESEITKVIGWINTAIPTERPVEFGKYTGRIQIRMNDGTSFAVSRAYNWEHVKLLNGYGYSTATPIIGEIVIQNDNNLTRAKSPALYEWLEEEWKHEVSEPCVIGKIKSTENNK